MTNEERIERLNATLYLASTVPAGRLDQVSWTTHNCQTNHCIAGWCGESPWHRGRGYILDRLGFPRYEDRGCVCSFAAFHGITYEQAHKVTLENIDLKGEAARRDVTRKLKALIRKYGGKVMYS